MRWRLAERVAPIVAGHAGPFGGRMIEARAREGSRALVADVALRLRHHMAGRLSRCVGAIVAFHARTDGAAMIEDAARALRIAREIAPHEVLGRDSRRNARRGRRDADSEAQRRLMTVTAGRRRGDMRRGFAARNPAVVTGDAFR